MPQRKAAKKDLRKNVKRKNRNLIAKSQLKKSIKKLKKSVQENNLNAAKENLKHVYKMLDKAATKKIVHPNKASRSKSRLTKLLKTISSKEAS